MKINNAIIDGITDKIWFYSGYGKDKEFHDLVLKVDDEEDESFTNVIDALESFALGYDPNYKYDFTGISYNNSQLSLSFEIDIYTVISHGHIITKEVVFT